MEYSTKVRTWWNCRGGATLGNGADSSLIRRGWGCQGGDVIPAPYRAPLEFFFVPEIGVASVTFFCERLIEAARPQPLNLRHRALSTRS
jgi:hypothetical protein